MKHNFKITLLLCLVLVATLATSAFTASGPQDDKVVFGGSYELASGESLNGNLVVLGGVVTLEQGSIVNWRYGPGRRHAGCRRKHQWHTCNRRCIRSPGCPGDCQ